MTLPVAVGKARSPLAHPARFVTVAFAAAIGLGTALLLLPGATPGPGQATLREAFFTATSAVTVTGLGIVDTAAHWTLLGEVVILGLIQIGGIGIMTLASLVLRAFSGRMGLRHRLVTQRETGVMALGEVKEVLRAVVKISLAVELVGALVLTGWLALRYGVPLGRAGWLGVFHSVSAFNNAGFSLYPDSLMRFVADPVVNLTVMAAVILGGLGVPVLAELSVDRFQWKRWSLHTKLVLVTSAVLIVVGALAFALFEWTNPSTLGPLPPPAKAMASLFQSVSPRTAGFNTLDYGPMRETTWLLTCALMFIGAAPVSTGGGIKVTTFAMLGYVILSEMRGDRDVTLFGRRIPTTAMRQAIAIALVAVGLAFAATLIFVAAHRQLGPALFEVTSAFGTVGLTTGITTELSIGGHLLLILLMFAGRVGPLTVGAALALRTRTQRFRLPEERPLIG